MSALFLVYKLVRLLARGQVTEAFANAQQVVDVERWLGIFDENTLQQAVVHRHALMRFLDGYYIGAHFVPTVCVLVVLYLCEPDGYARVRRILVCVTTIGLVIHVVYPLAPPRMLSELGFVDTGRSIGPGAYGRGDVFLGVANQFAAMPSLHFGWAALIAWAVIRYSPARYRYVTVVHPILMLSAIVLTANHYWLDAAVAGAIVVVVLVVDQRVGQPAPAGRVTTTTSRLSTFEDTRVGA
jgi:hypothetical protein